MTYAEQKFRDPTGLFQRVMDQARNWFKGKKTEPHKEDSMNNSFLFPENVEPKVFSKEVGSRSNPWVPNLQVRMKDAVVISYQKAKEGNTSYYLNWDGNVYEVKTDGNVALTSSFDGVYDQSQEMTNILRNP